MGSFIDANGDRYRPTKFLAYDDVILLPRQSDIKSRMSAEISTKTSIGSFDMNVPIISANMDTITDVDMAIQMGYLDGMGILHRFHNSPDEYAEKIRLVSQSPSLNHVAFSVGVNSNQPISWIKEVVKDIEMSVNVDHILICLDVAHADSILAYDKVSELRTEWPFEYGKVKLIVGNIASPEAAVRYAKMGVNALKIGIGNGANCQTRLVAGHGVPQLTAIMRIRHAIERGGCGATRGIPHLIADGGIRHSGDIVKALAAGADSVMVGSLFAGTKETPGEILPGMKKEYRGQASRAFMEAAGKDMRTSEGISTYVDVKGNASDVVDDLMGGLRSGMSYSGTTSIDELQWRANFIEVSQAGIVEGQTHMLQRDGVEYNGN